jgi:hypothetical protein
MKGRLLLPGLSHLIGSLVHQSLPFVVIQINHGRAFIYRNLRCANTESELAFASDFAIPVALAELSDQLITLVLLPFRELSVIEWFYLACLD